MNSLPFSAVSTYNPTPRSFTTRRNLRRSTSNVTAASPSPPSVAVGESEGISSSKRLTTTSSSETAGSPRSRREVLKGLGLCFSLGLLTTSPQLEAFAATSADDELASQCEFTPAASGLAYCDVVLGTGPEAVMGQLIKAHYVGRLEDGKVFDSSYDRGKPLTFRVGAGEVIKGWDQGILGEEGLIPPMLAGGKRKLKIPPELGYGARGAGCKGGSCVIPPNSTLYFDVEFIGKAA